MLSCINLYVTGRLIELVNSCSPVASCGLLGMFLTRMTAGRENLCTQKDVERRILMYQPCLQLSNCSSWGFSAPRISSLSLHRCLLIDFVGSLELGKLGKEHHLESGGPALLTFGSRCRWISCDKSMLWNLYSKPSPCIACRNTIMSKRSLTRSVCN